MHHLRAATLTVRLGHHGSALLGKPVSQLPPHCRFTIVAPAAAISSCVTCSHSQTVHRLGTRHYSRVNNPDSSIVLGESSAPQRRYSRYVDGQVPIDTRLQPPWRMLFFGTDDFAVPHLQALNENRLTGDVKVVERLDVVVPTGKSEIGRYAQDSGLQLFEWPVPTMEGQYDVGVVVSFGHLIPHRIISMFPYGIVNVHPSLLPRWRGASPVIHTILNGDKQTGISLMEIRPAHFDIGPLLLRVKYNIPEQCTAAVLSGYLASEGSRLLVQTLRNLPTLERLEHEQEATGITYAHKLSPRNARLNWELQTVTDIDRQYRAISQLHDLRTEWRGDRVRLLEMVSPQTMLESEIVDVLWKKYPEDQVCARPGIPFYHKQRQILCVRCKDGWVGFKNVVLRKPMTASSFYNGYLSKRDNQGVVFKSQNNDLDKYTFRTTAAQVKLKSAMA